MNIISRLIWFKPVTKRLGDNDRVVTAMSDSLTFFSVQKSLFEIALRICIGHTYNIPSKKGKRRMHAHVCVLCMYVC